VGLRQNVPRINSIEDSSRNILRESHLGKPFTSSDKSGGKLRLVIDMRTVNQFMKELHFKMEGTETIKEIVQKDDYAVTYDLKEAYNHVPLHPSFQPLLGIVWKGK
jgi:hypothetical protein